MHARDEPGQSALAGTILSGDRDLLACRHAQEPHKQCGLMAVSKLNRLEFQFPAFLWKVNSCGALLYARTQGEHLLQPADTGKRSLGTGVELGCPTQRIKKLRNETIERHQTAEAQSPSEHTPAAVSDHRGHREHNRYG